MKKITVLFGAGCLCAALMMACAPSKQVTVTPAEKPAVTLPGGIEVGAYGNLVGLKNAQGEPFFGKDAPAPFDGYAIAYRIGEMEFDKNDARTVYALRNQVTKDLLQAKPDASSSSVIVNTTDGALLITNRFSLDEKNGKLTVARTIRNNGTQPVSLIAIEVQTDGRFTRYKEPGKINFAGAEAIKAALEAKYYEPMPLHMHWKDCMPECPCEPYPGCLAGVGSPGNQHTASGARNLQDALFTSGPIDVPCLLRPEVCQKAEQWIVSLWSVGVNLPISPLQPGKEIVIEMGYFLR